MVEEVYRKLLRKPVLWKHPDARFVAGRDLIVVVDPDRTGVLTNARRVYLGPDWQAGPQRSDPASSGGKNR